MQALTHIVVLVCVQAETRREGIFVMPKERIEIVSTYVYSASSGDSGFGAVGGGEGTALEKCQAQVKGLQLDLHDMRASKLPS
jgi:hypothetical protein